MKAAGCMFSETRIVGLPLIGTASREKVTQKDIGPLEEQLHALT